MAYWWVNQGQTFKQEYAGGFLWAPLENELAETKFHWDNLGEVASGDIVFSYVNGYIRTVATALNNAYLFQKPAEFGKLWQGEGRCVDVKYFEDVHVLPIQDVANLTQGMWPAKYAPIQPTGRVNQGYLYRVPDAVGHVLVEALRVPVEVSYALPEALDNTNATTKDALVKARVGQGKFRKSLIDQWAGKCAITHFSTTSLLVASHIKPWALSDNRERLDPYNGLLLSPTYNALFDRFFISFSSTGKLIKSDLVSWQELGLLNIRENTVLTGLTHKHRPYLDYHFELMAEKKAL